MLNQRVHSVPFHFMWLGGLFWLAVIAAVIVLVIVLATRPHPPYAAMPPGPPPPMPPTRETPLDILARRFASGEITAEEYQKGRDLLTQPGGPHPS